MKEEKFCTSCKETHNDWLCYVVQEHIYVPCFSDDGEVLFTENEWMDVHEIRTQLECMLCNTIVEC